MPADRTRLDAALVARGLARSRGEARQLLDEGAVRLGGTTVSKASLRVGADDDIEVVTDGPRYVGRAAYKLAHALQTWRPHGLDVHGRRALDVGASTGGFTQVLLEAGAAAVVALDVGHGQLAEPLRTDPRVRDLSGTSIRGVRARDIGAPFDVVVADLSFISLTLVLDDLAGVTQDGSDLVLLVKPQFEVGRDRLARTGVVTSRHERSRVLTTVAEATQRTGLGIRDLQASPITGGEGNVEYLMWAVSGASAKMGASEIDERIAALTAKGTP